MLLMVDRSVPRAVGSSSNQLVWSMIPSLDMLPKGHRRESHTSIVGARWIFCDHAVDHGLAGSTAMTGFVSRCWECGLCAVRDLGLLEEQPSHVLSILVHIARARCSASGCRGRGGRYGGAACDLLHALLHPLHGEAEQPFPGTVPVRHPGLAFGSDALPYFGSFGPCRLSCGLWG